MVCNAHRAHIEHTVCSNLKQPTRQNVIDWVSVAWNSIKAGTIVDSFACCGIMDASDDREMFSHIPHVMMQDVVDTNDRDEEGDECSGYKRQRQGR